MASLIICALVVAGVVWLLRKALRAATDGPKARIAELEAAYWRAHQAGDVAGADQIEAELRDTPGSGWAGSERTS